jgi:hypothetical protein
MCYKYLLPIGRALRIHFGVSLCRAELIGGESLPTRAASPAANLLCGGRNFRGMQRLFAGRKGLYQFAAAFEAVSRNHNNYCYRTPGHG